MLKDALAKRCDGAVLNSHRKGHPTRSQDWDEVQEFCRVAYMPYRVRPLERASRPDATMLSAKIGLVTVTRFSYGTPIYLDRFDPAAGNVLVLNTLEGALRHAHRKSPVTTTAEESFVVDCSRTSYWLEGDPRHMQLNLTIPHAALEETAERWFGFIPDNKLWTSRVKFGGSGSRWLLFLQYVIRTLDDGVAAPGGERFTRHLEEMILVELLREWAQGAGVELEPSVRPAAPHYVQRAEEIFWSEARDAPSIGAVADRVGVSARTLSEGFRRFRGMTPRQFLAARRLDGVRAELESAGDDAGVAHVASRWGYVNFGAFAGLYRRRFGELPSETLRRGRCGPKVAPRR